MTSTTDPNRPSHSPLTRIAFVMATIACLVGLGIALSARGGDRVPQIAPSTGYAQSQLAARALLTLPTPEGGARPAPGGIPEHVRFQFLFEHLNKIKDRPGTLRNYQAKTGMSDAVFRGLVQLATEHEQQVAEIDRQANVIVQNMHAQYPRHLPPGVSPPETSQELIDLQAQRDALSLRFRDRLKVLMGDAAYLRFTQFMDTEFGRAATNVVNTPNNPNVPQREDK